jgi:hypothetical protein
MSSKRLPILPILLAVPTLVITACSPQVRRTPAVAQLDAEQAPVLHPEWTSYTNANYVRDLAFDQKGNLWTATRGE